MAVNVSNITLSPNVAEQISTVHKMLLWMQSNENKLRCTNITTIARAMTLSGPTEGIKTGTLCERFNWMLNHQLIYRYGGKRRANFRINYLHKDIPPDVLDNAPKSVQLEVKRALGRIEEGSYLDDVGCVVTPFKKTTPEEPKESQSMPAEEASDTPTETKEIAVPVKVERDGRSTNITITINLNI